MTSNPTVRKLSFTGSTAIGKLLGPQRADISVWPVEDGSMRPTKPATLRARAGGG
jgi:acyl-CoA reductase-like NAD-dependent aldehyde dehydrogenase